MKKCVITILLLTAALSTFAGCGKKILHCDHCGKEVETSQSSNMEEDWLIYCAECNEELFGDDPILGSEN